MNVATALELTEPRRKALEALLAGANVTQAATVAGVARETVSDWVNHSPAFRQALANAQAELWEQSKNAARALVPKALRVLSGAMDSRKPATRVRAAATLLRVAGLGRHDLTPPSPPYWAKREDDDGLTGDDIGDMLANVGERLESLQNR